MFSIDTQSATSEWNLAQLNGNKLGMEKCWIVVGKFSNSASVLVNNKWYIIGGLVDNEQSNKICVVDMDSMMASTEICKDMKPIDSHTATFIEPDKILVFGGYFGPRKSNSLWIYSLSDLLWQEVKPKGVLPMERTGHSAVSYEMSMYVFGGINQEGETMNDLWKYDTVQNEWKQIPVNEEIWPRPRSGHLAVVNKNSMYIFGGSLGLLQEVNDFLSFDFKSEKWSLIHLAEKMTSEQDRGSPITALKIKKIKEEANRKTKGESSSPNNRGIVDTGAKLKRDGNGNNSCSILPNLPSDRSRTFATTMRKTKKMGGISLERCKEDMEEDSSPILVMMKNNVVMKALVTERKKREAVRQSSTIGKFPCGRDGHSGQIVGDKLFIFGGDRCQMAYNDFHSFSLTK